LRNDFGYFHKDKYRQILETLIALENLLISDKLNKRYHPQGVLRVGFLSFHIVSNFC
jgi:hypothetical protein